MVSCDHAARDMGELRDGACVRHSRAVASESWGDGSPPSGGVPQRLKESACCND